MRTFLPGAWEHVADAEVDGAIVLGLGDSKMKDDQQLFLGE